MRNLLKKPAVRLSLVLVFLGMVFILLRYFQVDFSRITPEAFKAKIDSFGVWGPVMYIVFYILRPLILFPASVLSASAGVIWGVKGLIYLLIAANLSAVGEFLIARYFARASVERFIKGKLGDIDAAIEKRGFLTVLLIRLIPNAPWDVQNLGLGITKVRFRDFFWATLLGIIPGSFALVYFGSSFISVLTNPKNFWKILVAFAIFGAVYWLQGYLRGKKGAGPGPVTPSGTGP